MNEQVISGQLLVGPDGHGSYRYGIRTDDGRLIVSEHAYHNGPSAAFDGRRIQRVTDDGLLVPDSRWSPHLN